MHPVRESPRGNETLFDSGASAIIVEACTYENFDAIVRNISSSPVETFLPETLEVSDWIQGWNIFPRRVAQSWWSEASEEHRRSRLLPGRPCVCRARVPAGNETLFE